jgi:hypothetical protein
MAPEVLADPIGVIVDLVAAREPGLDRATIEATVIGVAGGRAKRRGLAQTLLHRPALLADGRSPAPRGIGDLLIALRNAGATKISPPVCAECGKPLRTLQRRGQDWYCSVCGPRPKRCACCGHQRSVATLDRRGRPRCSQCPDDADRDPAAVLTEVITTVDPLSPAALDVHDGDIEGEGVWGVMNPAGRCAGRGCGGRGVGVVVSLSRRWLPR